MISWIDLLLAFLYLAGIGVVAVSLSAFLAASMSSNPLASARVSRKSGFAFVAGLALCAGSCAGLLS
jgi:hypothetical protein